MISDLEKKILVIDGNSFFYRCYYATKMMVVSEKQNINGVYTAIKILKKYLQENNYQKVFIMFDFGKKTFRHQKFEQYKANRNPTPSELISQIPIFKKFLEIIKIKYFNDLEYEADDLVASMTKKALKNNFIVDIISNDNDLLQVIEKNVNIIFLKKGMSDRKIINLQNIHQIFALFPDQIVDFKALAGDPSDNIRGIDGIGKKTALKLIEQYQKIENILKNVDKLPKGLQAKIINQKENIEEMKEIIKIKKNIPLECDFEYQKYDFESSNAKNFYFKYKMYSLLKESKNKKLKQKRFF